MVLFPLFLSIYIKANSLQHITNSYETAGDILSTPSMLYDERRQWTLQHNSMQQHHVRFFFHMHLLMQNNLHTLNNADTLIKILLFQHATRSITRLQNFVWVKYNVAVDLTAYADTEQVLKALTAFWVKLRKNGSILWN